MAHRTTETVVRFSSPFLLPGFDAPAPAGSYRVGHDEESFEVGSFQGWRRVASFMHLPAVEANRPTREMAPVKAVDLEAALEKDHRR